MTHPSSKSNRLSALLVLYLGVSPVVAQLASVGASLFVLGGLVTFLVAWARGEWRWPFSRELSVVLAGFVAFAASAFISAGNNDNWDTAGWRFDSYYPWVLAIFVMVLLARQGIEQTLSARTLIYGCLVGGLLSGLLALYQVQVGGHLRAGVFTGYNPNMFAFIAGAYSTILLTVTTTRSTVLQCIVLLAGVGLATAAVLGSGSRGALLALAVAWVSSLLLGVIFQSAVNKRWIWGGVVVVVVVAAVALQSGVMGERMSRIQQQLENWTSAENPAHNAVSSRLSLWQGALAIWREHPLVGTGIGDGQDDYQRLLESGAIPVATSGGFAIFHNVYFDVLATTGLLGLLVLLVGLFFIPAWYFWRGRAPQEHTNAVGQFAFRAGISLLVYSAVSGLFNSFLFLRALPVFLVLLVLLLMSSPRAVTSK